MTSTILLLLSSMRCRVAVVTCILLERTFWACAILAKLIKISRYCYPRPAVHVSSSSGDGKRHTVKRTQQIYRL
ncbi:hypothetical protein PSV08DRAFT_327041 [Bipolaris maydis]|uniref:uncharacterized protein n=1 Tax=Cochliobolus heterostrophus TaxID=5016 RepID=UPI0024D8095E|nr:hypothetical protein J3E74DRAFT_393051 [Bipolaris maydis]KAJ5052577.1 hypothetical protein J3E74DRAFT_387867 [Bipolaris maydis]KAJ6267396.1 hypothetical protein PSV08DRAFT_325474 [Bipolaris maydis]KAJ6267652.1 hypothetical protein PSV08DRAFT_327041 [Bipolaris maydis]